MDYLRQSILAARLLTKVGKERVLLSLDRFNGLLLELIHDGVTVHCFSPIDVLVSGMVTRKKIL